MATPLSPDIVRSLLSCGYTHRKDRVARADRGCWTLPAHEPRESLPRYHRVDGDYTPVRRACPVCGSIHYEETDAAMFCTGWTCRRVRADEQKARTGERKRSRNMGLYQAPWHGFGSVRWKADVAWSDYCARICEIHGKMVAIGFLSEREAVRQRGTYYGVRFTQSQTPRIELPDYAGWYRFLGVGPAPRAVLTGV